MPKTNRKTELWLIALYALLLLAGLALLGLCVYFYIDHREGGLAPLVLGALAVIVPAAICPIALALLSLRAAAGRYPPRAVELLESINDRLLISDQAKRVAYREQDRNALRQAIRDDIQKRDFDAALAMVEEMSRTYGYREEAEEFRDQILTARKAEMERKVTEGIAAVDQIVARREWEAAMAEATKLQRLYPDELQMRGLDRRVREARENHKHELERQFLQAAERDDVELAMDLLKELDRYLSETEAEPFRETARGVIGKKRMNLGVQFKMAVHDKEATEAVRIAEQIIREFPNTKMADEVRGMLDVLRERAANEQAARARV
jgi:hypothetical protein